MRLLSKAHDGNPDSGVTGYFLIELKWLFSIVLLRFAPTRCDVFHNHAFSAVTIWLKGKIREFDLHGQTRDYHAGQFKYTPYTKFHKIESFGTAWAISFRGPWNKYWNEYHVAENKTITLTNGRKLV
jgi:hypothetical protein